MFSFEVLVKNLCGTHYEITGALSWLTINNRRVQTLVDILKK